MLIGVAFSTGIGCSCVSTPSVVMRPILLPLSSVNHSAPSGPAVMPYGMLSAPGSAYSVISPAVVIRPILLPLDSVNHSAPSGPAVRSARNASGVGSGYSVSWPSWVSRPIALPRNS